MESPLSILLAGIGATAFIDAWSWLRGRFLGVPATNFSMVGRWIGHMPRGQFVQRPVSAAAPVPGEGVIGWGAHYLIGVAFAGLLWLLAGDAWFRQPTLLPALLVGVATVLAPWLLLQPGMGMGVLAPGRRASTACLRTRCSALGFTSARYYWLAFRASSWRRRLSTSASSASTRASRAPRFDGATDSSACAA